jgi:hypothetical protein
MFPNAQGRHVGVMISQGQLTEPSNLPDLTLTGFTSLKFYAIEYVERGRKQQGLVVDANGTLYLAPNGMQWLTGMRELSERLGKNVKDGIARSQGVAPEDVPVEDNVDVIAQEIAEVRKDKDTVNITG